MNLPVRRSRDNAVVAGVCAGLARRWNVDPNLLRIAVVILALASGLGLIAYGIGVLVIPREGSDVAPVRQYLPFTRDWPAGALVAALATAGLVVFGLMGGWSGFGIVPVAIVAIGWYLVSRNKATNASRTAEPTPYERAAEAWRVRLAERQGSPVAPDALVAPLPLASLQPARGRALVPAPTSAPTSRRAGRLWWLALALMAISTGAVALAQSRGLTGGALPYLAVMLLSLGVTLVIATWRGRPRLMGAATVLVMLSTLATWVAPSVSNVGELRVLDEDYTFSTAADLPAEITATAGDLDIDFSDLTLTEDAAIRLELGAGDMTIQLPESVNSEVTWAIGAGDVTLPDGSSSDGLSLSDNSITTISEGAPTLRIDISMRAGSLEVNS